MTIVKLFSESRARAGPRGQAGALRKSGYLPETRDADSEAGVRGRNRVLRDAELDRADTVRIIYVKIVTALP